MSRHPQKRFSNVVGFDDAPFARDHKGGVKVVGAVYAGARFDGVLIGEVEKDGSDASRRLADLVGGSRFFEHVQLIMLQGITLGGFNVVDVFDMNDRLKLPVLVVARKKPDLAGIRSALAAHIGDGAKKWDIIERLGQMEALDSVFIQRVGLTRRQAASVLSRFTLYGNMPEPLRTAHMIAGALSHGQSRGSV